MSGGKPTCQRGVHGVCYLCLFAVALPRGVDLADIQRIRAGIRTDQDDAPYALPRPVKHSAALVRVCTLESKGTPKRLAVPAGSTKGIPRKLLILNARP